MKNMRIPLLIVWVVTLIGIVLGSFFDLKISSAIASAESTVGLTLSAIGPTIGFMGVAIMGGGFISFIVKGEYPIWLKVIFGVLALCCFGVSLYYPSGEYFGINGFYGAAPEWTGYLIVFLPELGALIFGYYLFRDCQNKNMWIVFVIIIVLLLLALLGIIPRLKDIMHRPRYRLIEATGVEFHAWWQPCKDYKELIELYNTASDNFKSYPSGHTAEAAILLVTSNFLPLAHEKFKKHQFTIFYVSVGLIVVVAIARILAAAHFLSDVSTGAFIMVTLLVIVNEVVSRIKKLNLKEE